MGFGPQLADLNGDGRVDVLSGSWPGEIYWFVQGDSGGWEEPVVLKTQSGAALKVGSASAVAPVDWDRDGDIDLVIGEIRGRLFLAMNEGTASAPVFAAVVPLMVGGEAAQVARDAGPTFADWDGDGAADLVCGDGDGVVWLFRGRRVEGAYELAAGEVLVTGWLDLERNELFGDSQPVDPEGKRITRSGLRAKVAVADWNVDGLPDLLVGDFIPTYGAKPEMGEKETAELDRVNAEWAELEPQMRAVYNALSKKVLARFGAEEYAQLTEQQQPDYRAALNDLMDSDEEFLKLRDQRAAILEVMRKYERPCFWHGWVWVYLQRPAGKSAKAENAPVEMDLDAAAILAKPVAPTSAQPITFAAAVSPDRARPAGVATVVLRARLAAGWYLYTDVPTGSPYLVARAELDLPGGVEALGTWRHSAGHPDRGNPAVQVVDRELVMMRRVRVIDDVDAGSKKITCRFAYQICNDRICLVPANEKAEVTLIVEGEVMSDE